MADWQMRTKRPLRGPVREEAGPTLKNYITPAGLQRLKDEHRFLFESRAARGGGGRSVGC